MPKKLVQGVESCKQGEDTLQKALKNYRQTIFNQTLFMPTTVVTEEQRQKLKPIFLDLNTFDKSCLKKTFQESFIASIQVVLSGVYPIVMTKAILYLTYLDALYYKVD